MRCACRAPVPAWPTQEMFSHGKCQIQPLTGKGQPPNNVRVKFAVAALTGAATTQQYRLAIMAQFKFNQPG